MESILCPRAGAGKRNAVSPCQDDVLAQVQLLQTETIHLRTALTRMRAEAMTYQQDIKKLQVLPLYHPQVQACNGAEPSSCSPALPMSDCRKHLAALRVSAESGMLTGLQAA